jgi:hypothetical protein
MLLTPSYLKSRRWMQRNYHLLSSTQQRNLHDWQGSVFRLSSPISTSLHLPDFLLSSMYLIPKCVDRQAYIQAFARNVSGNIVKMRKYRKSSSWTVLLKYIISPPETKIINPARNTHRSSQTPLTGRCQYQ